MTDEPPKPKRKRRRWLIAGVLLFVVGVVWWHWPRGDARFVGTWSCTYEGVSTPPVIYHLKSSGKGTVDGQTFLWNVEKSDFEWGVRGLHSTSRIFPAYWAVRGWFLSLFGSWIELNHEVWSVVEVKADSFTLEYPSGNRTRRAFFRRVTE